MQVIGDWVASHTHKEVLAAMGEARVPSGRFLPVTNSLLYSDATNPMTLYQ